MSAEYLKLLLDVLILAGLGGFMYFALKLSTALTAFRAHRHEFDNTMLKLNAHIKEAGEAIKNMRTASSKVEENLQKRIFEAQDMVQDLKLINHSAKSLAERLEKAAETANAGNVSTVDFRGQKPEPGEFFIQDREFDEDEKPAPAPASKAKDGTFKSQAEQDLMDALQKTGKNR